MRVAWYKRSSVLPPGGRASQCPCFGFGSRGIIAPQLHNIRDGAWNRAPEGSPFDNGKSKINQLRFAVEEKHVWCSDVSVHFAYFMELLKLMEHIHDLFDRKKIAGKPCSVAHADNTPPLILFGPPNLSPSISGLGVVSVTFFSDTSTSLLSKYSSEKLPLEFLNWTLR